MAEVQQGKEIEIEDVTVTDTGTISSQHVCHME